jgi:hypothetical protein
VNLPDLVLVGRFFCLASFLAKKELFSENQIACISEEVRIDSSKRVEILANHDSNKMISNGEFDPGSERTLAACLIHASRTRKSCFGGASKVANGCVTRG